MDKWYEKDQLIARIPGDVKKAAAKHLLGSCTLELH
jgi:hypothetical protein